MKKSRRMYKTQLLFVLYHCRNWSWKNQNSLSDLKSSCVTLIIHLALNLVVFVCSSHASKSVIQFHLSLYRNYFNFHTWELLENAWPVSENVWFFQEQINNWMLIVVYLSPLYATRSWLCCLLCKFFFYNIWALQMCMKSFEPLHKKHTYFIWYNSAWKGHQDVFTLTSCTKQSQLQGQTVLLRLKFIYWIIL